MTLPEYVSTGCERIDKSCDGSDEVCYSFPPAQPSSTPISPMESKTLRHKTPVRGRTGCADHNGSRSYVDSVGSEWWHIGDKNVSKSLIVYLVQVTLIYTVVFTSIYNLTVSGCSTDQKLWVAILASSIGYILPAPTIQNKNVHAGACPA